MRMRRNSGSSLKHDHKYFVYLFCLFFLSTALKLAHRGVFRSLDFKNQFLYNSFHYYEIQQRTPGKSHTIFLYI